MVSMQRHVPGLAAGLVLWWSAVFAGQGGAPPAGKPYEAISLAGAPLAAAATAPAALQQLEQARRDFDAAPTEDALHLARPAHGLPRAATARPSRSTPRAWRSSRPRTGSTGTAAIATSRSASSAARSRTSRRPPALVQRQAARGRAGRRAEQGRHPGLEHAVQYLLPPGPGLLS